MLKYAVTPAKMGLGVVIFSLEMSRMQIFYRIASEETGIELEKFIRRGLSHYEMEQYKIFVQTTKSWNIIIDDTPALSIQDMRLRVKQFKTKFQIDLVLSDYLQLHTFKGYSGTSRNDEVSKISGGLKSIAKEFNVPVIALSQLSRSVETRGGSKEPMLSDLRDSGSIEQDADMVQFLYRPEYYGITEDEKGQSLLGTAKIIIAKHRNGALDDAKVQFNGRTASFSNMAYFTASPVNNSPNSSIEPNKNFDNVPPF
jgi:replicative DNA helicase